MKKIILTAALALGLVLSTAATASADGGGPQPEPDSVYCNTATGNFARSADGVRRPATQMECRRPATQVQRKIVLQRQCATKTVIERTYTTVTYFRFVPKTFIDGKVASTYSPFVDKMFKQITRKATAAECRK